MLNSQINSSDTKALYADIYKTDGHNYGNTSQFRIRHLLGIVNKWIHLVDLKDEDTVVEVGASLGQLSGCHKNWKGFEYSSTAVELAKSINGPSFNIFESDARNLAQETGSVDFLFSFATLEHIPEVEKAFLEIERVIKPGGVALLAPAWNCRTWTVKKLQQRPYSELTVNQKIGKFLIPLRNNLFLRLINSLPSRAFREIKLLTNLPVPLDYKKLEPDFGLWDRYPHISDDDAFVSIDAHAALTYFVAKKWEVLSHPSLVSRVLCRGEEIVVKKPKA